MDLEALVALVVCTSPFIGGFVLVVALVMRPKKDHALAARVDLLEHELGRARVAYDALATRVSRWEAAAQQTTSAVAPEGAIVSAPAGVLESAPASTIESAPASTIESAPASVMERAPASVEQEAAASIVERARASAAHAASATSETAPPPAVIAPQEAAAHVAGPTGDVPPAPPFVPPPTAPVSDGDGGWERWIGVRGAAALGAMILVLAGLYFFQYSIEHGWIGPAMRVTLGALAGIGCVVASEWPLRQRFPPLAGWIAGAGIAILYITSWAASALYHLVPTAASGAMMVVVTIACSVLSVYRSSLPVALLGLVGGFLTPLALSTGADRPIPLFAYLLLLDAGMLVIAYRRRWPSLGVFSFAATALYQVLWIFGRMSSETVITGALVVVAFSALFAFFPRPRAAEGEEDVPDGSRALITMLRVGAVLYPFLLALAFTRTSHGALGLGTSAALLVALSIGGSFVARREGLPVVALLAASGAAGVLLIGLMQWELATWSDALGPLALALVIALVFHLFAELERERRVETVLAAAIVTTGTIAGSLLVVLAREPAWIPFAITWAVLLALALRQAGLRDRAWLAMGAALVAPVAYGALAITSESAGPALLVALVPAQAVLFQVAAQLGPKPSRAMLDLASALSAMLGALVVVVSPDVPPLAGIGAAAVLGVLTLFAASREGGPGLAVAAIVVTSIVIPRFAFEPGDESADALRLGLVSGITLLLTAWPALVPRLARTAWGWRASALAAPLAFLTLRHLWIETLGDDFVGALPVLLAIVSLGFAALASRGQDLDPAVRRVALVWLAAVSAGFVTVAIPIQLDQEWWTIGWALEGAALLALNRKLDHPGLKYLAMLVFGAVALRLVANPYVLGYYPRSELRIFNWLSYTYLVPSAAMLVGSRLLVDVEVARRRAWERSLGWDKPYLASLLFASCLVIVFAWLNLTIFDWFATGPELTIPLERLPARDLTISIAWALYALVLLALGMWRASTAMRVTSLGLILVTAAKIFLYDLGHLRDLYRVGALVGLALTLILVSLAYQRFVFRKPAPEAA